MTTAAPAISQAIAPIRPMLLDDQVKLNDPGASQYLINTLAQDGWNGLLRFYEGEIWRLRNRRRRRCSRRAELCRRRRSIRMRRPTPGAGTASAAEGRAAPAEARAAFARYLHDEAERARRAVGPPDDRLMEENAMMRIAKSRSSPPPRWRSPACSSVGGGGYGYRQLLRWSGSRSVQRRRRLAGGHSAAAVEPASRALACSTTSARSRTGP